MYYYVGRIISLWRHRFQDSDQELAYIAWYDAPYRVEGGLWYVDTSKPFQSTTVVPLDHINGHQVVVAEEEDKLWVLAFV